MTVRGLPHSLCLLWFNPALTQGLRCFDASSVMIADRLRWIGGSIGAIQSLVILCKVTRLLTSLAMFWLSKILWWNNLSRHKWILQALKLASSSHCGHQQIWTCCTKAGDLKRNETTKKKQWHRMTTQNVSTLQCIGRHTNARHQGFIKRGSMTKTWKGRRKNLRKNNWKDRNAKIFSDDVEMKEEQRDIEEVAGISSNHQSSCITEKSDHYCFAQLNSFICLDRWKCFDSTESIYINALQWIRTPISV